MTHKKSIKHTLLKSNFPSIEGFIYFENATTQCVNSLHNEKTQEVGAFLLPRLGLAKCRSPVKVLQYLLSEENNSSESLAPN